jgi:hypothetical protein
MQTQKTRMTWNGNYFAVVSMLIIFILYFFSTGRSESFINDPKLQLFKSMFISIIVEAMPFILIGVFISALLHVYVSADTLKRMIPKNPILGIITASLIGIIFPICECGMVPAIRNLLKKGMPLYVATTFILVGPILNPIVFWSTWTAFRNRPEITYSRMGLAFLIALVIGLIIWKFNKSDQLKDSGQAESGAHHHSHEHHFGDRRHPRLNQLAEVMNHTVSEFFQMGKYVVIGAFLVGLLQTFVAQDRLIELGQGQGSANLFMMGLGFILSLCSTSDAFVAQSFITTFSKGSLIAFMVFGPMLNLKSILMMLAVFKKRFVLLYAALVFVFVYVGTLLLDLLL